MPGFPSPPRLYSPPARLQLGVLLSLASIGVFFAALVLAHALVLQTRTAVSLELPNLLWLSTAVIAASSLVFERGRYALRRARVGAYRSRVVWTLALGLVFVAAQAVSWEQLVARGIAVEGNPLASAFYTFTGLHAAHLMVGLLGLWWVLRRSRRVDPDSEQSLRLQRRVTSAVATWWHSMGVLWLILFSLLEMWTA